MTAIPDRLTRLARALAVVTTRPPVATASVPLQLRNPLNGSGGTTKGARYAANERRKAERLKGRALALRLEPKTPKPPTLDAHCVVLTRISPKPFDDDNNTAALKSVRDGMAEAWGINDADPRVTWVVDWRKGKAHVVEAALWVVPDVDAVGTLAYRPMAIPPRQPLGEPFTVGRFVQDFDADDYNGRPPVVVHGGWRQGTAREVRVTPSLVRAKGGA